VTGVHQPEEDPTNLSRVRPAIAQQNTKAQSEGQAPGRPSSGEAIERDVGHGLRPRPARNRSEASRAHHRRYVLSLRLPTCCTPRPLNQQIDVFVHLYTIPTSALLAAQPQTSISPAQSKSPRPLIRTEPGQPLDMVNLLGQNVQRR
jgi:hypothetical protein